MKLLFVPSCDIKPINRLEGTYTLKRLEKAIQLWRTGQYDGMILSGGTVSPESIQTKPHADIMKEWVLQQEAGPSDEQIIVENCSLDTYENARFSQQAVTNWLAVRNASSYQKIATSSIKLTVVTEKNHGRRFLITFRRGLGWGNVTVVPADYTLSFAGLLLEWALRLMHLIDPVGKGPLARLNQKMRTQR